MNFDEALSKAQKLLRLATSSNPHEAALAAARAQELIERYNIEAASLALDGTANTETEDIKDFVDDPLGDSCATWKWRFLSSLVKLNGCVAYRASAGGYAVVGRPSDVQRTRYFFAWLCREIDRLCAAECKGNGRVFINNWRIGCAETIGERLRGQQKATRQAMVQEIEAGSLPLEFKNQALVRLQQSVAVVDKKLADSVAWKNKNLKLGSVGKSRFTSDSSARMLGRAAGHKVRMQQAAGNLN